MRPPHLLVKDSDGYREDHDIQGKDNGRAIKTCVCVCVMERDER